MANVIAVSALNKYVKSILESDPVLTDIAIQGEISNFNRNYKSGHCYFTLKDDTASVKAVMFRSNANNLTFEPENGMQVMARCRISLYERDGTFQLYVEDLFPDGVGAAQMAFEQLKQRLEKEGLFAPEHKKALPQYPQTVGLVTSKTGAALQDIINVANRRYPLVRFVLAPVTVQGLQAAQEIANAIRFLDKQTDTDAIIVARGGGSAEDLWLFNTETIARAAFACQTPLVSAIGHEIDYTILDFVADLRAPTPSAAAELVLPNLHDTCEKIENLYMNITENMQFKLNSWYNTLIEIKQSTAVQKNKNIHQEKLVLFSQMAGAIAQNMESKLNMSQLQFQAAARVAASVNPYAILGRGYSMATSQSGTVISKVSQTAPLEHINIHVTDGVIGCTVQTIEENTERAK